MFNRIKPFIAIVGTIVLGDLVGTLVFNYSFETIAYGVMIGTTSVMIGTLASN